MLRKMLAPETDINRNDHRVMAIKDAVRRACGSPARWYGLENSAIILSLIHISDIQWPPVAYRPAKKEVGRYIHGTFPQSLEHLCLTSLRH